MRSTISTQKIRKPIERKQLMKKQIHSQLPMHAVRRKDNTVPTIVLSKPTDRITNATTGGQYDGKELGRTSNRPGAYDFLACESRGFI
jgi:hypothetical protein